MREKSVNSILQLLQTSPVFATKRLMALVSSDQVLTDTPVERDTLADQVLQLVLGKIVQGELRPGDVVNEVDLARQLSVSRGPVREAIRRLEGRKLVTCSPFQRTRVVSLGVAEIREVFEMREGLEAISTRLACQRMSDEELGQLMASVEAAGREGRDFDIHSQIAMHCGNGRIREALCEELYYLLRLYRKQSGDAPGRRLEAREEHWQIVAAMKQRNAALAESLMRSHIRRATERLTQSQE
jgi:DNA-binding GntR family transcriptional regulator